MTNIRANGDHLAYGVKSLVMDTVDDLLVQEVANLSAGSTAFVIATSDKYMLNGNKKWVKIQVGNGGGGGGDIDPDATYIYDGGLLTPNA